MKTCPLLTAALVLSLAPAAFATPHYVDVNSTNATPPFLDWSTAATNIQDAVDAALAGDEVVVTNGVYATGGRAVGTNIIVNRVAVGKALTLRSVSGPEFTTIQGYQMPGITNGDDAIRCVYLTNGASLFGFTLTNGATRTNGDNSLEKSGGGLFCASFSSMASNCVMVANSAAWGGGGARGGNLYNSTLTRNSASVGGGAYLGGLSNCTLINNTASSKGGGAFLLSATNCSFTGNSAYYPSISGTASGGGAASCPVLFNCTLSGNSAQNGGGGAEGEGSGERLYNCVLTTNSAYLGGGTWNAKLINCTLIGNRAYIGGGAHCAPYGTSLTNCLVVANVATNSGGGINAGGGGTVNNCTIVGNSASTAAGIYLIGSVLDQSLMVNNCIVYSNTATGGDNYFRGAFNYCCTTFQPTNGICNITNTPLFVDSEGGNFRLQSNSPCINAGRNAYATGLTDLDGNQRIVNSTVDIGAYEYQGSGSLISYAWLQQYGWPTDGSADSLDPDGDGMNNFKEWRADTIPTNALSVLQMLMVTNGTPGLQVTWQSVPTRSYWLDRATDLASPPLFSTVASNLIGQAGTMTYADTTATNGGPFFYRVGVQP